MKISIRRSRRAATAVALGAALALTVTACGDDGSGAGGDKGSEGSGKGEIVFWDNNGGVRTEIWKEIIADFEKANPDIKVEYVGIASTEYQSKVDTALQGGGLPDVGGVGAAMLAGFAAQGALEPLDERLGKSSLNGKLNKDMVESLKAAGGGDDKLYSIPTSANNGVLYYRTDLFKKAGLQEPTTWERFFEAADKLTNKGKNEFGYTIRGGSGSIAQALDAMYGQSGITSFWDMRRRQDHAQRPEERGGAGEVRGAVQEGHSGGRPQQRLHEDGRAVGLRHDRHAESQPRVVPGPCEGAGGEKFRGIPQPVGSGGKRVQVSNPVDGLGLFKSGKNKEAAWKFIEFATSKAENSRFNEAAGQVPSNTDAASDAWISKAEPTKLAADALSDGSTTIVQLPYYLPDWNTISKADNEPNFQKVLLGKMSAKEFLDTMAEQLNAAQEEWDQQNG